MTVPPDAQTLTIRLPNVSLPSNVSSAYRCVWLKPPSDRKYHIYSVKLVSTYPTQRSELAGWLAGD